MSLERSSDSHIASLKTKGIKPTDKPILFRQNQNRLCLQQSSSISSYMKQASSSLPRINFNSNNSSHSLNTINMHNITNSIEIISKPKVRISKIKLKKLQPLALFNEKRLKKLYAFNHNFMEKISKIKQDSVIATKKDFTIDSYQKCLIRFASHAHYSRKGVRALSISLDTLKGSIENKRKPFLGKWGILAKNINSFAPKFLLEKLESM